MQSIKSPAFLHPFPPFLWGKGLTLLPLVMGTASTQTCIGAKCCESQCSRTRATSSSCRPAQPWYGSYISAGRVPTPLWIFFPSLSPVARQPWGLEPIIMDARQVYCREALQSCWTVLNTLCERFFFFPCFDCYQYFVPGSKAGSHMCSWSAAVMKSSCCQGFHVWGALPSCFLASDGGGVEHCSGDPWRRGGCAGQSAHGCGHPGLEDCFF